MKMATSRKTKGAIQAAKNTSRKKEPKYILARYTRLEALFEMIELGGVPLYGTEHWDDECDKEFVRQGCQEVKMSRCGIMCFSRAKKGKAENGSEAGQKGKEREKWIWPQEVSAQWLTSGSSVMMDDPIACLNARIRIEFDGDKLLEDLNPQTKSAQLPGKGPVLLFDKMDYRPFQKYLESASSCQSTNWFFYKRAAYSWEQEWRLVALNQKISSKKAKKAGAKGFIPVVQGKDPSRWNEVIKRVVFSPYSTARGASGKLEMERIRFYANRALDFYCIGRDDWSSAEKDAVRALWGKERGYRSGVLDNAKVLAAAKTKAAKPAKKAAAKRQK